jgi:hypothetical protein
MEYEIEDEGTLESVDSSQENIDVQSEFPDSYIRYLVNLYELSG